jgi:hypothetical protein
MLRMTGAYFTLSKAPSPYLDPGDRPRICHRLRRSARRASSLHSFAGGGEGFTALKRHGLRPPPRQSPSSYVFVHIASEFPFCPGQGGSRPIPRAPGRRFGCGPISRRHIGAFDS